MGSYMINFTVYTLAMLGMIGVAVFVYKKFVNGEFTSTKAKNLIIEETVSISPRKSLLVVKVGNERFLLASDIDKTTLISKLDDNTQITPKIIEQANYTEKIESSFEQPQEQTIENFKDLYKPEPKHIKIVSDNEQSAKRKTSLSKKLEKSSKQSLNNSLATIKEMAKKLNEM